MKKKEVFIKAPAKLNLYLDIQNKRSDSYHTLNTVMIPLDLCDDIAVFVELSSKKENEISVFCDIDFGIAQEKNIAYMAAAAFLNFANSRSNIETKSNQNVTISIKKHIPSGAGMGGGSSDGAAVLIALNDIYDTHFTTDELIDIGMNVGADIPFCIVKQLSLVCGIGEKITKINGKCNCFFVVIKPKCSINTSEAYANYDKLQVKDSAPSIKELLQFLEKSDINNACKYFFNGFEQLSLPNEISLAKEFLSTHGGISPTMTGSGSAVFAVFTQHDAALVCKDIATKSGFECYLCRQKV